MEKEYKYCLRCGRVLKSPESRIKGYGTICEKKLKNPVKSRLFEPRKKAEKIG